jgi:hypothetical protein
MRGNSKRNAEGTQGCEARKQTMRGRGRSRRALATEQSELEEPEASSFSLPQGSWTFQVVIRWVPLASLASQYAPRRSLLSLRRRRLRPGRRRRRERDISPSRLPPAGPPGSSLCSRAVIGRARRGGVIAALEPLTCTRVRGFWYLVSALQANRWNRTLATGPAAGVFFYAQGR